MTVVYDDAIFGSASGEYGRIYEHMPNMHVLAPDENDRILWTNGTLTMVFDTSGNAPVRLVGLAGRGMEPIDVDVDAEPDSVPIVQLRSSISGGSDNRQRLAAGTAGTKLRFAGAFAFDPDTSSHIDQHRLAIVQRSIDDAELSTVSIFDGFANNSAVRCSTIVSSPHEYPVEAVSSLNFALPLHQAHIDVDHLNVLWADSSWTMENQWRSYPLRDVTIRDRNWKANPGRGNARFARKSMSTWSTSEFMPFGIVEAVGTGAPDERPFSVAWQVEHNGPWEWEIGELDPGLRVTAYGPEYEDHQWFSMLGEGHDIVTVTATFAICAGDWRQAADEMTLKRRAMRSIKSYELGRSQQYADSCSLVVYNDYLHTVMGNPTWERESRLIDGAAQAGADVFCMDAGWFDETGHWWNSVGDWLPAATRYGTVRFAGLIHAIQAHGMRAGLWIEPEIVAVDTEAAHTLPDDAFFMRHGSRVMDEHRYHLDFRSRAARDHANAAIRRLINEFGISDIKIAYNTTPGPGSDVRTQSVGAALLDHCRAVQDWVDELRRTYPDVIVENSAAGAMRADQAMLLRMDLQSTSDQRDPAIYAAIAATASMTMLPEQQANWSFVPTVVQGSTEQAVLWLCNGIQGRLYLSGALDELDDERLDLVHAAVAVHRDLLRHQRHMLPWWPNGLPDFNDDWIAYGLHHDARIDEDQWPEDLVQPGCATEYEDYVTVWRRAGSMTYTLNVPENATIRQIFPPLDADANSAMRPWTVTRLDDNTVELTATAINEPSARVFAVKYH